MTRVIHTADTHVGYRQYHSPERRADFLAAFERVIEDAVEEGVDAVVHAGDLFHDRRPDLPDLLGTIEALRTLAAAEIPFLAVVGNHEGKRDAQWLDLFERLDLATRLDDDGVAVGEVTFYGLDYVPRSRRDELDYQFAEPETPYTALVAHGLFEPFAHADWDTEALLEASNVAFDALLLGDNHDPGTAQVGDAWVTYPGSTERASAAEEADRGYNVVEFGGEEGVAIARRGLPTREFVFVDVDLREGEGVETVRERVREHDLEDAVAYVRIGGDGEPFPPAAVEEFADERGALVARVNDRREVEEADADVEVSFADPDEAVRERVREMGLSGAAREVDETVRASGLADSNVRDAVADRVGDLLDDDPAAFVDADDEDESQPPDDGAADGESEADEATREETTDEETADREAPDREAPDREAADQEASDEDAVGEDAGDEETDSQRVAGTGGGVAGSAATDGDGEVPENGTGGSTATDGERDRDDGTDGSAATGEERDRDDGTEGSVATGEESDRGDEDGPEDQASVEDFL